MEGTRNFSHLGGSGITARINTYVNYPSNPMSTLYRLLSEITTKDDYLKPIKSPNQRNYTINKERLENGRFLAFQTCSWMEAHENEFKLIYYYVKKLQASNYKGRVRDRVADYCNMHAMKVGSSTYSFNNNYWPGISRYLVLVDETLKNNPIKFRDSDIDCYGLLPVSYLDLRSDND